MQVRVAAHDGAPVPDGGDRPAALPDQPHEHGGVPGAGVGRAQDRRVELAARDTERRRSRRRHRSRPLPQRPHRRIEPRDPTRGVGAIAVPPPHRRRRELPDRRDAQRPRRALATLEVADERSPTPRRPPPLAEPHRGRNTDHGHAALEQGRGEAPTGFAGDERGGPVDRIDRPSVHGPGRRRPAFDAPHRPRRLLPVQEVDDGGLDGAVGVAHRAPVGLHVHDQVGGTEAVGRDPVGLVGEAVGQRQRAVEVVVQAPAVALHPPRASAARTEASTAIVLASPVIDSSQAPGSSTGHHPTSAMS